MDSLIIVVGGTGKSVAAVYLMLAKFFGKPADIVVLDMRFGGEDIDKELDKEGIKQEDFMTPWPGGATAVSGVRFADMIGLTRGDVAEPVAKTLFSDSELNTLVEKGMNARPIVGATVAMRKFFGAQPDPQVDNLRQRVAPYTDIFVVGSITGGTGSGVMPTLGRWLTEECGKRVHGILFLPWIKLGAGTGDGPSDADLQSNAYAVLNYLKETDPATNPLRKDFAPFCDYVVIGNPPGLEPDASATSGSHPLSLAAATYLVYFEEILTRNPQTKSGPYYLELTSGGIRAAEMQPRRVFSLEQAINRQDWFSTVLHNMAGQKPDEAWDLAVPVPAWLGWRALRASVRGLALMSEGRGARGSVWQKMSEYFRERALITGGHLARFGAITSRDKKHLVYNISMETLEKQAKGYRRRALATASSAETPNLNSKLSWDNAAKAAAEKISEDVFEKLGRLASESITAGGAPLQKKEGSSTVFLPSGVEDAEGGIQTIARKPLGNLEGLIQKYAGAVEAINMPTPEARRFQFEITLEQALENYVRDPNRPKAKYDSSEPLAQFTALLEGIIFGVLQIKLFDLESYGFKTSPERRILGVLVDKYGEVYGGTGPETLVFPAPGSWTSKTGALRRLSDDNVTKRDEQTGQLARKLLQKFRSKFTDGGRSLWMRAMDEYLHIYPPPDTNVNEQTLNAGWKHAGPIQMRMPDKSVDARYLPVFEADFVSRATNALSGEFTWRDSEIHLKIANSNVGRILYPENVSSGLTLRLMGAGSISVLPSASVAASNPQINYDHLQDRCQALIGDSMARVNRGNVVDDPFKYPDVIRLPFARDGILAEHYLMGGKDDEKYGGQFLNAARGNGLSSLPQLRDQQPAPALVIDDQKTHYFVDQNEIIYVERYEGFEIGELSLLGQALWSIFIGEGTEVQSKRMFVDASGKVLLEYNDHRFMPGPELALRQPDTHLKAAYLRCLAHKVAQPATDRLFKEAVTSWLDRFSLNPDAGSCERSQINIGGKRWWRS